MRGDVTKVNYRALDDLFHTAQQREAEASYTFCVQMLEIYNEQVVAPVFCHSTTGEFGSPPKCVPPDPARYSTQSLDCGNLKHR
eukprot:7353404-Pyramimonas_sp.AAC.1